MVGAHDGEYYTAVARLIDKLGVQDHVHCVGNRNDVAEILQSFDVFVISSKNEGFSNAIVEAMASGVPVIAPASGGNPEAIEDGRTGLLVRPQDSVDLADAMIRLCSDAALRARFSAAGRERVRAEFTIERMISDVAALFEASRRPVARAQ
jgi:glycosyltransferase involved in cell wall biosynthesis